MPWWMPWSCKVRIISRPVRSPTWARRGYLWPPKLRWRMRPSLVRSKTAPHASSSRTRSGASRACSSAIRQLLTYCPPRIVSAKWTFQLSRASTLASAAAIPPSAITVCALPSSDLQTRPTLTPFADASIAARKPAPPAPITITSWTWVLRSLILEKSPVRPDAHRAESYVDVGERHPAEAHPGPHHVPFVEAGGAREELLARRLLRHLIEHAADQMAQRMAAEGVTAQQG